MDNESNNFYNAPDAELEASVKQTEGEIYVGPQKIDFSEMYQWIPRGGELFKRSPGGWVLAMLVGFAMAVILSLIPLVNILFNLCVYVFIGGMMIGAKAVFDGGKFEVSHLFSGFSASPGRLILLGLVPFLLFVVLGIFMAIALPAYQGYLERAGAEATIDTGIPLAVMGISFILGIGLTFAIWFAPALIVLQKLSVMTAIRDSFLGCLKNAPAMIVFWIAAMVLMIIGALPALLGLLVVIPILFGASFAAYQGIFVRVVEQAPENAMLDTDTHPQG